MDKPKLITLELLHGWLLFSKEEQTRRSWFGSADLNSVTVSGLLYTWLNCDEDANKRLWFQRGADKTSLYFDYKERALRFAKARIREIRERGTPLRVPPEDLEEEVENFILETVIKKRLKEQKMPKDFPDLESFQHYLNASLDGLRDVVNKRANLPLIDDPDKHALATGDQDPVSEVITREWQWKANSYLRGFRSFLEQLKKRQEAIEWYFDTVIEAFRAVHHDAAPEEIADEVIEFFDTSEHKREITAYCLSKGRTSDIYPYKLRLRKLWNTFRQEHEVGKSLWQQYEDARRAVIR
jgi:hypothetical protein